MRGPAALVAAMVVASTWIARPAAAECPIPYDASPALADHSSEERMRFLLARTQRGEEAARLWTALFAAGYTALAMAEMGVIVFTSDPEQRIDMGIGAAATTIGIATLAVFRMPVLADRATIEALAPRAMGGDCIALARAEDLLRADADSEAFGQTWLMHVGNVVFNLGVGLLLGLGYGHWISGAVAAGVGIAVGELQILTHPTDLVDALARYRAGDLSGSAPAPEAIRIEPVVGAGTLGVRGVF